MLSSFNEIFHTDCSLLLWMAIIFGSLCGVRGSIELRRRKKKPEEMKRDEKGKMGSKSPPSPPSSCPFLSLPIPAQLPSLAYFTDITLTSYKRADQKLKGRGKVSCIPTCFLIAHKLATLSTAEQVPFLKMQKCKLCDEKSKLHIHSSERLLTTLSPV